MTYPKLFAALLPVVLGCAPPSGGSSPSASTGDGVHVLRVAGGAGALRVSDGGPRATGASSVVFVHGLGSDLDVWKAQLAFVRSSGRRAVAYDQRGHGQSDRPRDGVYTFDALAGDLEAVRAALELPRIVLVGHSISGDVVTTYAAAHPERVAGIVYADADGDSSSFSPERREEAIAKDAAKTREQWKAEWDEMVATQGKPETRRAVLDAFDRVETKALPALLAASSVFPGRSLAARYEGPRWAIETKNPGAEFRAGALDPSVHLVTIPNVSHWLMLDDPAAFDAALGQALATMP